MFVAALSVRPEETSRLCELYTAREKIGGVEAIGAGVCVCVCVFVYLFVCVYVSHCVFDILAYVLTNVMQISCCISIK